MAESSSASAMMGCQRSLSSGSQRACKPSCSLLGLSQNLPAVAAPPQNGSMILYNRKKVKYRKDGYCWKKRKDGKTTREDHMKLKVQGVEVRNASIGALPGMLATHWVSVTIEDFSDM
ncbi:hypothetical protein AOLI_G00163220 [Acnodon oligacanthus]